MRTALLLALLAAATATAADQQPDAKPKRLTVKECEAIVEQLANPDQPPFKGSYVLDFPDGYDMQKLEKSFRKIEEAYNLLSENVEVALPILIKHLSDNRYSFVQGQQGSGVYSRRSVSHACYEILESHVEVHRIATYAHDEEGRPRGYWFVDHCGGYDKWWSTRKEKGLADLQLEAMEWVLTQKRPEEFKGEKDWKAALAEVEKMAETIRTTRKPIIPKHRFECRFAK